jgi:hypothetical protein
MFNSFIKHFLRAILWIPVERTPVRFLNVGLCFIGFVFFSNFLSNILLLGSDQCLGLDENKKNEEKIKALFLV